MLKVTTTALEQLKAVLSQEGKQNAYIRIYINGIG